tara:strand:- start:12276 stop:13700 length:1425 start_codon:yes stop_codon:yes gene_type:complete
MRQSEAQDPLRNLARYVQPALDMMELDRARKERDEERAYSRARDAVADERYAQQVEYKLDRDRITDERLRLDRQQNAAQNAAQLSLQRDQLEQRGEELEQKKEQDRIKNTAIRQETDRIRRTGFSARVQKIATADAIKGHGELNEINQKIEVLRKELPNADKDRREELLDDIGVYQKQAEILRNRLEEGSQGEVSPEAIMKVASETGDRDIAAEMVLAYWGNHLEKDFSSLMNQLGVSEERSITGAKLFSVGGRTTAIRQIPNKYHDAVDSAQYAIDALRRTPEAYQKSEAVKPIMDALGNIVAKFSEDGGHSRSGPPVSPSRALLISGQRPRPIIPEHMLEEIHKVVQSASRKLADAPAPQPSTEEQLRKSYVEVPLNNGGTAIVHPLGGGIGVKALPPMPIQVSPTSASTEGPPKNSDLASSRVDHTGPSLSGSDSGGGQDQGGLLGGVSNLAISPLSPAYQQAKQARAGTP